MRDSNDVDVVLAVPARDVIGKAEDPQPSTGRVAAARFPYFGVRDNKVEGVDDPVEEFDAPAGSPLLLPSHRLLKFLGGRGADQ